MEITKIYDKVAPKISSFYDSQTHIRGIKEFVNFIPKKAKVLDLGSGMGKDVALFSELGYEAVGVDGSKGMIGQARKRYPNGNFLLMDLRNLSFPENHFDAAWSWSVLTHLQDTDKRVVLERIYQILKPGGYFTQMVWRGRGVFVSKDVYPRTHYLLSAPSWKKLYKEAGFENLSVKFVKGKSRGAIRLTGQKA